MRNFTPYHEPPVPTEMGQIYFWVHSDFAVSMYVLRMPLSSAVATALKALGRDPGLAGLTIRDMSIEGSVAEEISVEDVLDDLGEVVYPDIAAFKADTGWRTVDVLAALGVDIEDPNGDEGEEGEPGGDVGED